MNTLVFDPPAVFRAVWRTTLDEPGWAVLVPPEPFDSFAIRREMLRVLAALGDEAGGPFAVERLGRFDQQVTTKFHRDGWTGTVMLGLS